MDMEANEIPAGTIVQYRKVGTFQIVGRNHEMPQCDDGSGWYLVVAVKAPKRVRDLGTHSLWMNPRNVVS